MGLLKNPLKRFQSHCLFLISVPLPFTFAHVVSEVVPKFVRQKRCSYQKFNKLTWMWGTYFVSPNKKRKIFKKTLYLKPRITSSKYISNCKFYRFPGLAPFSNVLINSGYEKLWSINTSTKFDIVLGHDKKIPLLESVFE